MTGQTFVRFESAVPNRFGHRPGVFALVGGLRAGGRLDDGELAWWQDFRERAYALYDEPPAELFVEGAHPDAVCWYRAEATQHIALARECLDVLDSHGVAWQEVRTATPGTICFQDHCQVVADPLAYPEHWPFPGAAPG